MIQQPPPADNAAAGSQPGPIPLIDNHTYVADLAHYSPGRHGYKVKKVVIHDTEKPIGAGGDAPSGLYLSTTSQPPNNVSIHHLYGRSGTRYDLVKRADCAYHCGVSAGQGYKGSVGGVAVWNWISIGHELESSARLAYAADGYTDAQYNSVAYTVACELVSYGLTFDADVVSHMVIARPYYGPDNPANARNDPSHFDWARFRTETGAWVVFLRSLPPVELPRYCL